MSTRSRTPPPRPSRIIHLRQSARRRRPILLALPAGPSFSLRASIPPGPVITRLAISSTACKESRLVMRKSAEDRDVITGCFKSSGQCFQIQEWDLVCLQGLYR
ncbi:hypothetical protein B0H63DRAFT_520773 [Podospora didyma]|uniref:Uncharacterized protein n=1 Tax=Podospora didyma TaxID=330526 RepID=A0AAE0NS52_9PEZI|nr:hypothetical protein B0H63DRAFT_520773 [Podospora didyma]